jgi:carbon storage regulator CsrA
MLVLSRKIGERVVIAGGIVVEVLSVKGRWVRLGFEATPDVAILRGELAPARTPKSARQAPVRKPR